MEIINSKPGDIITDSSGEEWIVLENNPKSINNNIILLKRRPLMYSNKFSELTNDWSSEFCIIRNFLNAKMYEVIKNSFEYEIAEHVTKYHDDKFCLDYISLLNVDQYLKYKDLIPNDGYSYWLSEMTSYDSNNVFFVNQYGSVDNTIFNRKRRVMPYIVLDYNSRIKKG